MGKGKIFFVGGLPRSGSTLLMNVLGQNPNHYVSPTSGLIDLFCMIRNNWKKNNEFRAEGLEVVKPRVLRAMKNIILGYYEKELSEGKVVFDKCRGWPHYVENLEEAFGEPVKVIVLIRDIRDILASFEKLYRKRGIEFDYGDGEEFTKRQTVEGRCESLLSPGGIVGLSINRVTDALMRKKGNLIIVPYKAFTESPKEAMDMLHEALDLPKFDYDPTNVKQVTHENDLYHGMNLHVIKPKIEKDARETWHGILPDKYVEYLNKNYAELINLAKV